MEKVRPCCGQPSDPGQLKTFPSERPEAYCCVSWVFASILWVKPFQVTL